MLCGGRIHVTHARPRTRGLGRRYYNPNMRCYECGIPGHFYRDCPELYERNHGSRYLGLITLCYGQLFPIVNHLEWFKYLFT